MSRGISLVLSSSTVEKKVSALISREWWAFLGWRSISLVLTLLVAAETLRSDGLKISDLTRPPKSWERDALSGLACGLVVVVCWHALQFLLSGIAGGAPPNSGFSDFSISEDMGTLAGLLLMAVVVGPLAEEFEFRAYALESLTACWGEGHLRRWAYAMLSASAFALSHSVGHWAHLPLFFVTGLAFAWLYLRTRSLAACVIAHGATNLLQMAIQCRSSG